MRKTLFNLSLGFALTLGVFSFVGCGGGSTETAPATEQAAPAAEQAAPADTAAVAAPAAPADTTKH